MQVFTDETEFPDIYMIQSVVGMFESQHMRKIIACGLLGIEYDEDLDLDEFIWANSHNSFHGYQEAKKSKEKAEKKRLKKQKQKQRKQMEKGKQNEEGKVSQRSNEDDSNSINDVKKNETDSKMMPPAAAKDEGSDISEEESSDKDEHTKDNSEGSEELDMASTFVSKAALIAKRQLEQKSKSEKEKKKSPEKEKNKNSPEKPGEDEVLKKVLPAFNRLSLEDNVKISTSLAIMGNKFASSGDFQMAVKYFTDAIKHNPKEFKLFGNRSFCFEKLQEYEKALLDAEVSLNICPGWLKGLFRKGRALAGLKRYEEAAQAFQDVLKLDSSYAEAAQELMRVHIIQLMGYGFTREESSNALIIHGTPKKALEVLSKLHHQPGSVLNGTLPPAQVANVTGVSPVLSANSASASSKIQDLFKKPLPNTTSGPFQNTPSGGNQPKPPQSVKTNNGDNQKPLELFPVWVGNLTIPVTEETLIDLFSEVGEVYSVKLLTHKRCAFVNFTNQEDCDAAISYFHGHWLDGLVKIIVRYPDRIPSGKTMMAVEEKQQEARSVFARSNPFQIKEATTDSQTRRRRAALVWFLSSIKVK